MYQASCAVEVFFSSTNSQSTSNESHGNQHQDTTVGVIHGSEDIQTNVR